MKANTPQECNTLLAKAFNEQDMDTAISFFENESIFIDHERKEYISLMAIKNSEQAVVDMKPKFEIETVGVTKVDSIALLRSKWHLVETKDNKPVKLTLNDIEVVRKQKDSSWLYIIGNPFFAD